MGLIASRVVDLEVQVSTLSSKKKFTKQQVRRVSTIISNFAAICFRLSEVDGAPRRIFPRLTCVAATALCAGTVIVGAAAGGPAQAARGAPGAPTGPNSTRGPL